MFLSGGPSVSPSNSSGCSLPLIEPPVFGSSWVLVPSSSDRLLVFPLLLVCDQSFLVEVVVVEEDVLSEAVTVVILSRHQHAATDDVLRVQSLSCIAAEAGQLCLLLTEHLHFLSAAEDVLLYLRSPSSSSGCS